MSGVGKKYRAVWPLRFSMKITLLQGDEFCTIGQLILKRRTQADDDANDKARVGLDCVGPAFWSLMRRLEIEVFERPTAVLVGRSRQSWPRPSTCPQLGVERTWL